MAQRVDLSVCIQLEICDYVAPQGQVCLAIGQKIHWDFILARCPGPSAQNSANSAVTQKVWAQVFGLENCRLSWNFSLEYLAFIIMAGRRKILATGRNKQLL